MYSRELQVNCKVHVWSCSEDIKGKKKDNKNIKNKMEMYTRTKELCVIVKRQEDNEFM